MKKFKLKNLVLAVSGCVFFLLFISCSLAPKSLGMSSSISSLSSEKTRALTPFDSVDDLNTVTNGTTDYIFWGVARVFALIELEKFRSQNNWNNATLSPRPIIIYDSLSRPKYYEFRVILNNQEIGAITAIAQKKDGDPIRYVMSFAKDYGAMVNKWKNYKIIEEKYPTKIFVGRLAGINKSPVSVIDPDNGNVTNSLPKITLLDILTNANSSILSHLKISNQTTIQAMIQIQLSNQTAKSNFWSQVEQHESNIIQITDDEIAAKGKSMRTKSQSDDIYELSSWANITTWPLPTGQISCLPYCCTFISIGARYFPGWNYNDGDPYSLPQNAVNAVNQCFFNTLGTGDGHPYYETEQRVSDAFSAANVPLSQASWNWHTLDYAKSDMQNNGFPDISLEGNGLLNLDIWNYHYRVVFGTDRQTVNVGFWVTSSWWWNIATFTYDWYHLQDDGADHGTSDYTYWEESNPGEIFLYPISRNNTKLISPPQDYYLSGTINFAWTSLTGATSYNFSITYCPQSGQGFTQTYNNLTATNFSLALPTNGLYFWSVQANGPNPGVYGKAQDYFYYGPPVNIALKACINNKYVSMDNPIGGPLMANRSTVGLWETFTLESNIIDNTVSLKNIANNLYVTMMPNGADTLEANRGVAKDWEQFYVISNTSDNTISFKNYSDGNYVGVEPETCGLMASDSTIGAWNKFYAILNSDGSYWLKSAANNKCVTVNMNDDQILLAVLSGPLGSYEDFYISPGLYNGTITLKNKYNNLYVTAADSGKHSLVATQSTKNNYNSFYLIDNGDGTFSLQCEANNLYVTADDFGKESIKANRTSIGSWERFYMESK